MIVTLYILGAILGVLILRSFCNTNNLKYLLLAFLAMIPVAIGFLIGLGWRI